MYQNYQNGQDYQNNQIYQNDQDYQNNQDYPEKTYPEVFAKVLVIQGLFSKNFGIKFVI